MIFFEMREGKVVVTSESGLKVTLGTGSEPEIRSDHSLFRWTDYGEPDRRSVRIK